MRHGLLVLALASFGSAAPVAESPHRRLWNHWRAGFPRIHQWLAHHGWTPPTEPIPTMGPTEQIPAGPPSSNPSKGFVGTVSSPPPSSPPWGPYVPPNLNCGSCQHNPRQDCRGDAFASCPQKYPFPRYYYSKFDELFAKTASEFCKEAYTQTNGKGKKYDANTMGCDSATVSKRKAVCPLDAAEIFLYHCAQAAGWENCLEECNGALLLLSGEAVPVGCEGEVPTREDNNYHFYLPDPAVSNDNPGNIWQTDASAAIPVDESATKLLEQARSDCGKPGVEGSAEEHVPAGFISAGNPNWIGSFCHVSTQYKAPDPTCDLSKYTACNCSRYNGPSDNGGCGANFAWGGGSCSGGSASTPFPTDPVVINDNQCTTKQPPIKCKGDCGSWPTISGDGCASDHIKQCPDNPKLFCCEA